MRMSSEMNIDPARPRLQCVELFRLILALFMAVKLDGVIHKLDFAALYAFTDDAKTDCDPSIVNVKC